MNSMQHQFDPLEYSFVITFFLEILCEYIFCYSCLQQLNVFNIIGCLALHRTERGSHSLVAETS